MDTPEVLTTEKIAEILKKVHATDNLATLIIGIKLVDEDKYRLRNLTLLLHWLEKFYKNLFDIIIVEQGSQSRLDRRILTIFSNVRYEFIYNPGEYNRGWLYNTAVKNFCKSARVVAMMDCDIVPGANFVDEIINCHLHYDVISPYTHIYYTNEEEFKIIKHDLTISHLQNTVEKMMNPVTITGGILIIKHELFLRVCGFEQYIGYGGEDRAMDVTLLNLCETERINVAAGSYIHLYHPREEISKIHTSLIMEHLFANYKCKWDSSISANEYIHKNCNHSKKSVVNRLIQLKAVSFGDPDLYRSNRKLTVNGIYQDSIENINSQVLPEIHRCINESRSASALRLCESALHHYSNSSIMTDVIRQKIELIKSGREKSGYFDLAFFPHKKYHSETFANLIPLLENHGLRFIFVDMSAELSNEGSYLPQIAQHFVSYKEFLHGNYLPATLVCMNDWENGVVQPMLNLANKCLLHTVALIEGVNDYHDVDVRKKGSVAHYRNAYGTAANVILNGEFDRKYFSNSLSKFYVGGLARLDTLSKYKKKRKEVQIQPQKILVNLNFSYGVLEHRRMEWLSGIIAVCKKLNVELIISQHPNDNATLENLTVSQRPLYEDLTDSAIFITRFSGAVFESLQIGCPVIYYNPKIEKIDKFSDPLGAYLYTTNESELESAINQYLSGLRLDSDVFLMTHCATKSSLSDKNGNSSNLTTTALNDIVNSRTIHLEEIKRFKAALQQKSDFLPIDRFNTAHQNSYLFNEKTIFCKAINVNINYFINKLVWQHGYIYLISIADGQITKKLFLPNLWNTAIHALLHSVSIYEIDTDIKNMPGSGYVFSFPPQPPLLPGLTFLIRAKNEYRNIYFVLGSLRGILNNQRFQAEVVFIDNNSTDGTYEEVIRVCTEQKIQNVFLYKYPIDISRSGDEHTTLPATNQMHRSLDTYYNWCLDKANKFNIAKWDADFLALNDNLVEMLEKYDLPHTDRNLAVWCSGKTLFKNNEDCFVNLNTGYNEFRIFSKLHGYQWSYAPRWEISSKEYLESTSKMIFAKSVYLELKDLQINEFAHRSNATFIASCTRDSQDFAIMEMISNNLYNDPECIRACGIEPTDFVVVPFNPLLPRNYDTTAFNNFECTFRELQGLQGYWLNDYSQKNGRITFTSPNNLIVQGLWVGEAITDLHKMCVQSFINNGHCFVLYTYGPVKNVPEGVVFMDAAKIIPESLVYKFNDSYAGFSDIFRSKLMFMRGGWYVDLDIFNLKKFDFPDDYIFSLDHYPQNGPVVKSKTGMTIMPINEKYYIATNPLKMTSQHQMAREKYHRCLTKILSKKIFSELFHDNQSATISKETFISYISNLSFTAEFENYFFKLTTLPSHITFSDFLLLSHLAPEDVGQNTWNEIGPRLVSEKVLEHGMHKHMFEPSYFQGFIPYYEAEKFIDPDFDFKSPLNHPNLHSIDLFFTMWKNKNLLGKKDQIEGTLYKHLFALAFPQASDK